MEEILRALKKKNLEHVSTEEMEEIVVSTLNKAKPMLEKQYGLRISKNASDLAVTGLGDGASPEKAVKILDGACKLVLEQFRNCAFESRFYEKAYRLRRALVELIELYRDYYPGSQTWVDRLRHERDCASIDMMAIIKLWSSVLNSSGGFGILIEESANKPFLFHKYIEMILSPSRDDFVRFLDEIQGRLYKVYFHLMTVQDCHVAEVISSMTDVPLTHILPPIHHQKIWARYRTNQRVASQEHLINEMFETLVSQTQRRNTTRPRGLFLLLGPSGVGKSEIAKAVAEHWYCDATRLVEIDMSEYVEPQLESSEACDLSKWSKEKCGVLLNRLSEIVVKRPYSVILLDKIDKASFPVTMVLLEVLSYEASNNNGGNPVDFSKSIIFMTSSVGSKQLEFDCSLNSSARERVLIEAKKFFSAALVESLDKVFVVEKFNDWKTVARLLLREIVGEVFGQRVIVHASDDALGVIFRKASEQYSENGHGIKNSLLEHIIPMLSAAEGHNNVVVCVDTLVGTNELSFRFQVHEQSVDDWYFKLRRGSFAKMIANIRMKINVAFRVFDLRNICLPLLDCCSDQSSHLVELVLGTCNELISCPPFPNPLDELVVCNESKTRIHANMLRAARTLVLTLEEKEKIMNSLTRLAENDVGVGRATRVIVQALVNVIDAPSEFCVWPARYYLFLGLDAADAKAGLINCLIESLKTGSCKPLFTYVKLDSNCRGEEVVKLLIDGMKERPCWVLMFDGVEYADSVLYRSLLEIFDKGVLEDGEGFCVDFQKTVVILTSEAANKCQVVDWFGYEPRGLCNMATSQNVKRFRTELLHRLDEIFIFDPLSPGHGDIRVIRKSQDSDYIFSAQLLSTLFKNDASSIQHSTMPIG